MVRLDQAIVLPGEIRVPGWNGWPFIVLTVAVAAQILPWAMTTSALDAGSGLIPGPDGSVVLAVFGGLTLLVLLLAWLGWRRLRAPSRRAQRVARRIRRHALTLTRALESEAMARVRGVARVQNGSAGQTLHIEDSSGRVRVEIDETLKAFCASGPRRAICDGDVIEVCGELVLEFGEAAAYRDPEVRPMFARGATVFVG